MPSPLPWKIEQNRIYPYVLIVKAADNTDVFSQGLYAYSSQDKTAEAANSRPGNDVQRNKLELIVQSVNRSVLWDELLKTLNDHHVHQNTRGDGSKCWICDLIRRAEEIK